MARAVRHRDRLRPLALAGLVLALALTGWRAAEIFTTHAPPAPASAAESQLMPLAEALAGPGHVRLMLTRGPAGTRQLTVLLDETASHGREDMARLLAAAAALDSERGERIVVETAAFAPGLAGRPAPAAWAELGGLVLLSLICAILSFSPQPVSPAGSALTESRIEPEYLAALPDTGRRPLQRVSQMPGGGGEATEITRQDPAAAAGLLRRWMKETDAA